MEIAKAQEVVQGLKEAGINFAVGLPDSQFHEVYEMITQDPAFKYVGVGNEGEGAAIAMGAWCGGKKPALIIATSGLLVATFSLARLHLKEIPLMLVIPYRGDLGDPRWMGIYKKYTEPMLNVMDIPYRVVNRSAEIKGALKDCQMCAEAWIKPVAVLLTGRLYGKACRAYKGFCIDGGRGHSRRNSHRQHYALLGRVGKRIHKSHFS